jgi:outer membrane protein assembly factor BamB
MREGVAGGRIVGNGRVFISHSHDDNPRIVPLLAALDAWGSAFANVYAVDAQTGTLVRKYITAGAIIAPPLVANGILYAADLAGYLYAFGLS